MRVICADALQPGPASGMLKPTGDSRITAAFSRLERCMKCVGFSACGCRFSLSLFASLPPLSFSRHGSLTGRWRGGEKRQEERVSNSMLARPLPLRSSSLASCGIEEEYGFSREGGGEEGGGSSWLGWVSMGRMPGCKRGSGLNVSGEWWLHYWNLNGVAADGGFG